MGGLKFAQLNQLVVCVSVGEDPESLIVSFVFPNSGPQSCFPPCFFLRYIDISSLTCVLPMHGRFCVSKCTLIAI